MKKLYFIISVALLSVTAPADIHAQVPSYLLTQQWNGNNWVNSTEGINYTYNSDCNELYDLRKTWNATTTNWDNYLQEYRSYPGGGKSYQDSIQQWNSATHGWNNNELATYTYDGNNYLINESVQLWDTATNNWQNVFYQINYVNNTDGTPHIVYDLLLSGGVWDTSGIQTYIYNTPGQLDTEYSAQTSGSGNITRFSYTYITGYVTKLDQIWSTTSNSWQNEELSFNYPQLTYFDSLILETWNSTTNVWNNADRLTATYTPCTPAAIAKIDPASPIAVYPDPSSGHFSFSGLVEGQSVEIYNCEGQRLDNRIANHTTMDFNIAAYASGMYLVRVQNQDGSMSVQKKIVKTQ